MPGRVDPREAHAIADRRHHRPDRQLGAVPRPGRRERRVAPPRTRSPCPVCVLDQRPRVHGVPRAVGPRVRRVRRDRVAIPPSGDNFVPAGVNTRAACCSIPRGCSPRHGSIGSLVRPHLGRPDQRHHGAPPARTIPKRKTPRGPKAARRARTRIRYWMTGPEQSWTIVGSNDNDHLKM
jgi:hypothetical protein